MVDFKKIIVSLFAFLFFAIPLVFYSQTSEVFEFNKLIVLYIVTTIIAVVWGIEMALHKKVIFQKTSIDLPLLLFLVAQGISTLISIEPRTSFLGYYSRWNGGLLSSVCYAALYWAFVNHVSKKDIVLYLKILLSSTAIASVWGVLEHFGKSPSCLLITQSFDVSCWVQDVALRVFSTFGQPNWLGAWLGEVVFFSYFLAFIQRRKNLFYVFSLLPTLLLATLIFTKSRSGILAFAGAFVLFWGLVFFKNISNKTKEKKLFINSFVIQSIVAASIVVMFGTPWTPALFDGSTKQENKADAPALESGGTESGQIRKIVWEGAINVWLEYPLLGSGVETFALSYYKGRPLAHNTISEWNFLYNKAHNEYLNLLATTGIVGLGAYLFFVLAAIYLIYKHIRRSEDVFYIALLCAFVAILASNFLGFSVVPTSILFFLIPAFCISWSKEDKQTLQSTKNIQPTQYLLIGAATLLGAVVLFFIVQYWRADYLYAHGKGESDKGNFSESLNYFRSAINISPEEPLYHSDLGTLYANIAEAASQESTIDKATVETFITLSEQESALAQSLAPQNVRFLKSTINSYITLGAIDPEYYLKLLSLSDKIAYLAPTDPTVPFQKALTLTHLGHDADALNNVLIAINMKPDYRSARKLAALLYSNANEKDKAREQLEYILTNISPNDEEIKEFLKSL